jgi:predicted AlkP superfamily phosphohydrolase/phosphomutase
MGPANAPIKALIIGIDGGSFDVIDPLISAGGLPSLAGLLDRAVSARTTCTWPAHTAPGWSSFVTACHPGGHGIYQFFDTQDPDYGAVIRQAGDLGRSCVWDWLARSGYTLGLINIPMSHPPRDLPGYQITWPLAQTLRFCHPPGLLSDLTRAGAHFQPDLATMFRGDLGYIDQAEANVRDRTRSARLLIRQQPTDVVMLVFTEVDRVCHHYWHFCDDTHPRHEPAPEGTGWQAAITRIYEAIDSAIGELLDEVSDDTVVVVVSDHGLGVGRHELAVNALLESAGLLATRPVSRQHAGTNGHGRAAHRAGPAGAASWFASDEREVDFSRTYVYSPVPGSFGLNVNLTGRQRDGIASDRDDMLAQAESVLSHVELPGGGPAFRAIVPREVGYQGPHLNSAPDLMLIPADESFVVSAGIGADIWRPSWQTGLHRYSGMWLQASPRVRRTRLADAVSIVDLIPTLLTDIGAGWPAGVHGGPLLDAFDADPVITRAHPYAEQVQPWSMPEEPGEHASRAEDAYTAQRLREMGYI